MFFFEVETWMGEENFLDFFSRKDRERVEVEDYGVLRLSLSSNGRCEAMHYPRQPTTAHD